MDIPRRVVPIDVCVNSPLEGRKTIRAIDVRYGTKQVSSSKWALVCFIRGRGDDGFLCEYEVDARWVESISIQGSLDLETESGRKEHNS